MNSGDIPLVLVIDDDPDQLALVQQAVARAGNLRVMTAEGGPEALAQLEARRSMQLPAPNLVLTDLKMPDMTGLELMRVLHERPEMTTVPILFMSASGYNRDRILVHLAGAEGFFLKPVRFADLVALMKVLPSYILHRPHPDSEREKAIQATTSADHPECIR